MKKIIIALLTVVMIVCCFSLVACNDKKDQEALKNYIFENDGNLVTEDFTLPAEIGGKEAKWTSDKPEVTLEKNGNEYLAKVNLPESGEVEVNLTLTIGKASEVFTVRVKALTVYDIIKHYTFLMNRATVTKDFDLDRTTDEYKGKTASITWSVDPDYELYIAISEDGNKCLVTPQGKPTPVKINGTFEYKGVKTVQTFNMTIYREMSGMELVDYWYTNTGVSIDMSGYVVLIGTEYSSEHKNVTLYMVNDDFTAGYYLYRVKTTDDDAALLKPGVHITVTGTTNTDYNGLIETNAGGSLVVDKDIPEINVNEKVFAIDELVLGNLPATIYNESRLVSFTNWKVKDVKEPDEVKEEANFTLMTITKGGVDVNIRISKYLEGAYKTAKGDATWKALCGLREKYPAGTVVNVTGIFTRYGNKWQVMPLKAEHVTKVEGVTADPDDKRDYVGNKVAEALKAVNAAIVDGGLYSRVTAAKEATLPTTSGDVAISYTICGESKAVVIDGGKFTVTPGNPENTQIKATYKVGEFATIQYFYIESLIPTASTMLEDLDVPDKIDKVTDLPTIDGQTINWTVKSGSDSLAIVNNQLIPTLSEKNVLTSITAELTYKGETRTKDYIVIVKAGKGAVAVEAPFVADKEYYLAVNQGNLDKTLYGLGEMEGHYMKATDKPDDAKPVKVEVVDGKYKIYFETKDAKKYIGYEIADNKGKKQAYLAMVDVDAPAWEWDAENKCFKLEIDVEGTKAFYYFGSYNKFNTLSLSDAKYVSTSFPAFLSTIQFVPLTSNEITVDAESSDKATVTLGATTGLNGQRFTFTVAVEAGYEIVAVKVNGESVEAVENVYTGVVKGATTVKVETKVEGAEDPYATDHAGTEADPFSVADVLKLLDTLEKGATYSKDGNDTFYIKGYVITGEYNTQYKNFDNFTIGDTAEATTTVVCFRPKMAEGVTTAAVGDLVVLKGKLQWYQSSSSDSNSKQVAQGASIVSVTAGEAPGPKTDAEKVADVLAALEVVDTNFTANGEMLLPVSTDSDVKLEWASDNATQAVIDINAGKVTFTVTDTTVVVKLTVTATCNEASDTKTFDITLGEVPPQVVTVAEALELPDTTKIIVTGVVTEINEKWSEKWSNITVTITDAAGGELYIYRLATNVGIGDTITVTGEMGTHSNNRQVAQGATATIDAAHVCTEWSEADCVNAPKCTLCSKDKEGAQALGHVDEDTNNICDRCSFNLAATTTTLNYSVADNASSFTDATKVSSPLALDDNIELSYTGGNNTGKFYANGNNIRIYQGENPTVTISAKAGYTIVSVKITYSNSKDGILTLDGANITTDTLVNVNASSVTFGVGSTGTEAKGQVRITNIEVVYQAN